MKPYFSKPNYTDVSGPNWTVVNASDGTQALNDLSALAVKTVAETPYGGYVTAAHADPIFSMFSATSVLSTKSRGTRWTVNELSGNVRDTGDTFVYVDSVEGFTKGQVAAILEGISQDPQGDAANTSVSPDAFYSEWLDIGSVGLIPASPTTPATSDNCLYFPVNASTWFTPITSGQFDQQGVAGAITPAYVGSTAPDPSRALYISASADQQAQDNLLTLLPDWVGPLQVTAISVASDKTTVTLLGTTLGLAQGQTLTIANSYNGMGFWAGIITGLSETTVTGHTVITTTLTTANQGSGSFDVPANLGGYVLPSDVAAGRYCLAFAATLTDTNGVPTVFTVNNTSNALGVTFFTTPYLATTVNTDQSFVTQVEGLGQKVRYYFPATGATGAPNQPPSASAVGQFPIVTVTGIWPQEFNVYGAEIVNCNAGSSYFEVLSSATDDATVSLDYATATFYLPGSVDSDGNAVDGSHYGANLFFPINVVAIDGPPVATFQAMSDATSVTVGGTTYPNARVISVDDVSNIFVGQHLAFREEYTQNLSTTATATASSNTLDFSGHVVANHYSITGVSDAVAAQLGIGAPLTKTGGGTGWPAGTYITNIYNVGTNNNTVVTNHPWRSTTQTCNHHTLTNSISTTATGLTGDVVTVASVNDWFPHHSGSVLTVVSNSGGHFTIQDENGLNQAPNSVKSSATITFASANQPSWYVIDVNSADTTFTIACSSLSAGTVYTVTGQDAPDGSAPVNQPMVYANGASANDIYAYDSQVDEGATLDVAGGTTGAGVIAFTGVADDVKWNHVAGTVVGSYDFGPRYIGSETVGDLEVIDPIHIGSRTQARLHHKIKRGAQEFSVNANPNTLGHGKIDIYGTYYSYDTYGNTVGWLPNTGIGGFTTLADYYGLGRIDSGYFTNGSAYVTGVANAARFFTIGDTVEIVNDVSYTYLPANTTIIGAVNNGNKGWTLWLSNAYNGSNGYQQLRVNIATCHTVIVGSGETAEAVVVITQNPTKSTLPHEQTLDGRTGAAAFRSPFLWKLAPGQKFHYDHKAGEPVSTPNLPYRLPSFSKTAHAKNAPILGAPDNAVVYDITNGTNYTAAAAIVASNLSGDLFVNAETEIAVGHPWVEAGVNGQPNTATILVSDTPARSSHIKLATSAGQPTTEITPVLQSGLTVLPPEIARLAGDVVLTDASIEAVLDTHVADVTAVVVGAPTPTSQTYTVQNITKIDNSPYGYHLEVETTDYAAITSPGYAYISLTSVSPSDFDISSYLTFVAEPVQNYTVYNAAKYSSTVATYAFLTSKDPNLNLGDHITVSGFTGTHASELNVTNGKVVGIDVHPYTPGGFSYTTYDVQVPSGSTFSWVGGYGTAVPPQKFTITVDALPSDTYISGGTVTVLTPGTITVSATNNFSVGDQVALSGLSPSSLNTGAYDTYWYTGDLSDFQTGLGYGVVKSSSGSSFTLECGPQQKSDPSIETTATPIYDPPAGTYSGLSGIAYRLTALEVTAPNGDANSLTVGGVISGSYIQSGTTVISIPNESKFVISKPPMDVPADGADVTLTYGAAEAYLLDVVETAKIPSTPFYITAGSDQVQVQAVATNPDGGLRFVLNTPITTSHSDLTPIHLAHWPQDTELRRIAAPYAYLTDPLEISAYGSLYVTPLPCKFPAGIVLYVTSPDGFQQSFTLADDAQVGDTVLYALKSSAVISDTTVGSTLLTPSVVTATLYVGQPISGTGIDFGTTIAEIQYSADGVVSSITLSNPATADGTATPLDLGEDFTTTSLYPATSGANGFFTTTGDETGTPSVGTVITTGFYDDLPTGATLFLGNDATFSTSWFPLDPSDPSVVKSYATEFASDSVAIEVAKHTPKGEAVVPVVPFQPNSVYDTQPFPMQFTPNSYAAGNPNIIIYSVGVSHIKGDGIKLTFTTATTHNFSVGETVEVGGGFSITGTVQDVLYSGGNPTGFTILGTTVVDSDYSNVFASSQSIKVGLRVSSTELPASDATFIQAIADATLYSTTYNTEGNLGNILNVTEKGLGYFIQIDANPYPNVAGSNGLIKITGASPSALNVANIPWDDTQYNYPSYVKGQKYDRWFGNLSAYSTDATAQTFTGYLPYPDEGIFDPSFFVPESVNVGDHVTFGNGTLSGAGTVASITQPTSTSEGQVVVNVTSSSPTLTTIARTSTTSGFIEQPANVYWLGLPSEITWSSGGKLTSGTLNSTFTGTQITLSHAPQTALGRPFVIHSSSLTAPSSLTLGSGGNQEVVYPATIPTTADGGRTYSVRLAHATRKPHDAGNPTQDYQYPDNPSIGDVTYRPDLSGLFMWDGTTWRSARCMGVRGIYSLLGPKFGNGLVQISIVDSVTGNEAAADTFSNLTPTGWKTYHGGNHATDPNKQEWTGDSLSSLRFHINARVPLDSSIGFRSISLEADYVAAPLCDDVFLSPSDSMVITKGSQHFVGWQYDGMGDNQTGWEVKIYTDEQVSGDGFDPASTEPVYRISGNDDAAQTEITTAYNWINGRRYWAYVRVAKNFQNRHWWSDWKSRSFYPILNQPSTPTVTVYTDDENSCTEIVVQSADNLLGPNNGSFTNSAGGWDVTSNDTAGTSLDVLATAITTSEIIPTGKHIRSIPIGADGYLRTAITTTSQCGDVLVWGHARRKSDPIGFPISGQFWITIGSEAILVHNKADGNNSGDHFTILERGYRGTTPATYAVGAAISYGLQDDVYIGSTGLISWHEKVKTSWATKENVVVRYVGGKAGVGGSAGTGPQVLNSARLKVESGSGRGTAVNGSGGGFYVFDPNGYLTDGWVGQTAYLDYHEAGVPLEPVVITGVSRVGTGANGKTAISSNIQFGKVHGDTVLAQTQLGGMFGKTYYLPFNCTATPTQLNTALTGNSVIPPEHSSVGIFHNVSGSLWIANVEWKTNDGTYASASYPATFAGAGGMGQLLTAIEYGVMGSQFSYSGSSGGVGPAKGNIDTLPVNISLPRPPHTPHGKGGEWFIPGGTNIYLTGVPKLSQDVNVHISRPHGHDFATNFVGGKTELVLNHVIVQGTPGTPSHGGVAGTPVYGTKTVHHDGLNEISVNQDIVVSFPTEQPPTILQGTYGNWSGSAFSPVDHSFVPQYFTGQASDTGAGPDTNTIYDLSISTSLLTTAMRVSVNDDLAANQVTVDGTPAVYDHTTITILNPTAHSITLNKPVKSTAYYGTTTPYRATPIFNAVEFSVNPSVSAGDAIIGQGIPDGATVTSVITSGGKWIVRFTNGNASAGEVQYSALDPVTNRPVSPVTTNSFMFVSAPATVIPAGSRSLPVRPFKPSNRILAGTPVTVTFPVQFGTHALGIFPSANGTSEISTLANGFDGSWTPRNSVPVIAGLDYGFMGWSCSVVGSTLIEFVTSIDWCGEDGSLISSTASNVVPGDTPTSYLRYLNDFTNTAATVNYTPGGWSPAVAFGTAPDGAAYAVTRCTWNGITTSDVVALCGLSFKALTSTDPLSTISSAKTVSTSLSTTILNALNQTVDNSSTSNALNLPLGTPYEGYSALFVLEPATANQELILGGSENYLSTVLVSDAAAGDTAIQLQNTFGLAAGASLTVGYQNEVSETVTVTPDWDGTSNVTISALANDYPAGTPVWADVFGLARAATLPHDVGSAVAVMGYGVDGYVNAANEGLQYKVERSTDGGITWQTLWRGANLVSGNNGRAVLRDYEVANGEVVEYRVTPTFVIDPAVGKPISGPTTRPIQSVPIENGSWYLGSTSDETLRFKVLVQNAYTEQQQHTSGVFYPLGSSRPITVAGVPTGRDGDITITWTDLEQYDNFRSMISRGETLLLSNPVEGRVMYIFINQNVQFTNNAAANPWRDIEIQYVEAAPPGFGYTYGS